MNKVLNCLSALLLCVLLILILPMGLLILLWHELGILIGRVRYFIFGSEVSYQPNMFHSVGYRMEHILRKSKCAYRFYRAEPGAAECFLVGQVLLINGDSVKQFRFDSSGTLCRKSRKKG